MSDHPIDFEDFDEDEPTCAECGRHVDLVIVDGLPKWVHSEPDE